jgi:hypothetical protein
MPLSEAAKYVKPLANNILALELKDLELIHLADGRQVSEISLTIINISALLKAYTENISKNLMDHIVQFYQQILEFTHAAMLWKLLLALSAHLCHEVFL